MRTHAVTLFVAHRSTLPAAIDLFSTRVRRINPQLATVLAVDAYATAVDNPFHLWDLRATAVYEGTTDVESLELFSLSCLLEHNELTDDQHDELTRHLFFCDPTERDPFPATVYFTDADNPHTPSSAPRPSATLIDGLNLLTVYALVPQPTTPQEVFTRACAGLNVQHTGPIVDTQVEDSDIFGALIVAEVRKIVAGEETDYPPGRRRMRQRLVVRHSGDPLKLQGLTGMAVAYEAEPLV